MVPGDVTGVPDRPPDGGACLAAVAQPRAMIGRRCARSPVIRRARTSGRNVSGRSTSTRPSSASPSSVPSSPSPDGTGVGWGGSVGGAPLPIPSGPAVGASRSGATSAASSAWRTGRRTTSPMALAWFMMRSLLGGRRRGDTLDGRDSAGRDVGGVGGHFGLEAGQQGTDAGVTGALSSGTQSDGQCVAGQGLAGLGEVGGDAPPERHEVVHVRRRRGGLARLAGRTCGPSTGTAHLLGCARPLARPGRSGGRSTGRQGGRSGLQCRTVHLGDARTVRHRSGGRDGGHLGGRSPSAGRGRRAGTGRAPGGARRRHAHRP